MTLNAAFFLLPLLLLFSTKVIAIEEEIVVEHRHAHAPAKPPALSPKGAPAYLPRKAPAHSPKSTPPPHPALPPAKSINHPGVPSPLYHHNHGNCIPLCLDYCRPHHSKRECLRQCVPCCDQYKCVPGAYKKCSNWDGVIYHGQKIKCPKFNPTHELIV